MHLNKKDRDWCETWNGSERVRIVRPMMGNFKKKMAMDLGVQYESESMTS